MCAARGNTLPTKLLCWVICKPSTLDQQSAIHVSSAPWAFALLGLGLQRGNMNDAGLALRGSAQTWREIWMKEVQDAAILCPLRLPSYALPIPSIIYAESCECLGETCYGYGSILEAPLCYPVASISLYYYSEQIASSGNFQALNFGLAIRKDG
ncbi:hypothetical protein LZ30DRAFT_775672 [Colletotrichum cereale]|nr:hypothetical protein LZ30DRAFT_775672 [Colletotrichum cereale]